MNASRRGYAAGSSAVKRREADHSTTIVIEHGEWKFHDNYFGGEPYGGREVVFLGGQPVWMAVYYGQVDDANVDLVYSFLQRSFPVRGPEAFTEGRRPPQGRAERVLECSGVIPSWAQLGHNHIYAEI
jgi:hypothetical protein